MSKRQVSTDALETLGMVHTKQEYRDAIHLAVEPIEAGQPLMPSEYVKIKNGKAYSSDYDHSIGMVDPFIRHNIDRGDRFWLVIHPRKITSLRHVWTHPDIDNPVLNEDILVEKIYDQLTDKDKEILDKKINHHMECAGKHEEMLKRDASDNHAHAVKYYEYMRKYNKSEMWLRNFIETAECPDYDTVIKEAIERNLSDDPNHLHFNDDAMGEIPDKFWDHLEIVTGKKFSKEKRAKYFSCSC